MPSLPVPDPITKPYWDSLRANHAEIQKCLGCGKFYFYPRAICPSCHSRETSWERITGQGEVFAFTICERHHDPAFDLPYVLALVRLDEGVVLLSILVDVEPHPEQIKIGMKVEIAYRPISEQITLPIFKPTRAKRSHRLYLRMKHGTQND